MTEPLENPFEAPRQQQAPITAPPLGGAWWLVAAYLFFSLCSTGIGQALAYDQPGDLGFFFSVQGFAPLFAILLVVFTDVRRASFTAVVTGMVALLVLFIAPGPARLIGMVLLAVAFGSIRVTLLIWMLRLLPADRAHQRGFLIAVVAILSDIVASLASVLFSVAGSAGYLVMLGLLMGVLVLLFNAQPAKDVDEGSSAWELPFLGVAAAAWGAVWLARVSGFSGAGYETPMQLVRSALPITMSLVAFVFWLAIRDRKGRLPVEWIGGTAALVSAVVVGAGALLGLQSYASMLVFQGFGAFVWPLVVVIAAGTGDIRQATIALALYSMGIGVVTWGAGHLADQGIALPVSAVLCLMCGAGMVFLGRRIE